MSSIRADGVTRRPGDDAPELPRPSSTMTRREYREHLAALEASAATQSVQSAASQQPTPELSQTMDAGWSQPVPPVMAPSVVRTPVGDTPALETPALDTSAPASAFVAPACTLTAAPAVSRRDIRARRAELEAQRAAEMRRARRDRTAAMTAHLPRVGIVGALGLATVVAPMVDAKVSGAGAVAADRRSEAPSTSAAPSAPPTASPTAEPISSLSTQALRATTDFRVIPDKGATGETLLMGTGKALPPAQLIASRMEAERASRDLARPVLPGCDGVVRDAGAQNGRLDTGDLCKLWVPGHYLRADAAVALAELNVAYTKEFGKGLEITDSYRSYEAQVRVRARKPGLAARPGTSEHGWALAVDLGGGVEAADKHYRWLVENAPKYGWDNPEWARKGGSGPYEPWHWEFVEGQAAERG